MLSYEDKDNGSLFGLKYQLNRDWSVEMGYQNFGNFVNKWQIESTDVEALREQTASITPISGNGIYALLGYTHYWDDKMYSMLNLGIMRWDETFQSRSTNLDTVISANNGTDLKIGAGLGWQLNEHLSLSVNAERQYFADEYVNSIMLKGAWKIGKVNHKSAAPVRDINKIVSDVIVKTETILSIPEEVEEITSDTNEPTVFKAPKIDAVSSVVKPIEVPKIDAVIYFKSDSTFLNDLDIEKITNFSKGYQKGLTILLTGLADGSTLTDQPLLELYSYNKSLAKNRAQEVKNLLVKLQIPEKAIKTDIKIIDGIDRFSRRVELKFAIDVTFP